MKWLALHVGGQVWSVHLVGRRAKHLRSGQLVGCAVYEECKIYILRTAPESVREDTLLHELMHVLLHVSGADKAYGEDVVTDETVVTAVTPLLHRLLRDLGFRFPKGPGE